DRIAGASTSVDAKLSIRPVRLVYCPGVPIDAGDRRRLGTGERPRSAANASSAAEIRDHLQGPRVRAQRDDDGLYGEKVERTIKQRECRAFARALERSAGRQPLAPLDIAGRQRTERPRQLGAREIGQ